MATWQFLLAVLAIASWSEALVKMVATPVVYTNGAGGGSDEIEVPAGGKAQRWFDVGNYVAAAWWVPYDNIKDLSAIAMIETQPSGTQVELVVGGTPNQPTGRTRIMIYADVYT